MTVRFTYKTSIFGGISHNENMSSYYLLEVEFLEHGDADLVVQPDFHFKLFDPKFGGSWWNNTLITTIHKLLFTNCTQSSLHRQPTKAVQSVQLPRSHPLMPPFLRVFFTDWFSNPMSSDLRGLGPGKGGIKCILYTLALTFCLPCLCPVNKP